MIYKKPKSRAEMGRMMFGRQEWPAVRKAMDELQEVFSKFQDGRYRVSIPTWKIDRYAAEGRVTVHQLRKTLCRNAVQSVVRSKVHYYTFASRDVIRQYPELRKALDKFFHE